MAREAAEGHELPPGVAHGVVVVDRWQDPDPVRPARHSSLFSRALAVHRPEDGVALRPAPDGYPWWEGHLEASADLGHAYRYVLRGPGGQVAWEHGEHRPLPLPPARGPMVVVDEAFRGRPGWRGAGVAVPVFTLRGATSLGVGQFTDLPAFIDWTADAGLTVLQLLPVNDTIATHGWDDSYPTTRCRSTR